METDKYLDPSITRAMCDDAIEKLELDNSNLSVANKSVTDFCDEASLQSKSFDALKQQMSNYETIISAITTANEYDISDFTTLKNNVGYEILDGHKISEKMSQATASRNANATKANARLASCESEGNLLLKQWYKWSYDFYVWQAGRDQKVYDTWAAKSAAYDRIEGITNGLFFAGTPIRKNAVTGLEFLGTTFSQGAYTAADASSWQNSLQESIDASEKMVEARAKIDISVDDYNGMSKEDKEKYAVEVAEYIFLLKAAKDIMPGQKVVVYLSPTLKATYSVDITGNVNIGGLQVSTGSDHTVSGKVSDGTNNINGSVDTENKTVDVGVGGKSSSVKATIDLQKEQLASVSYKVNPTLPNGKQSNTEIKVSTGIDEDGASVGASVTYKAGETENTISIKETGTKTEYTHKVSSSCDAGDVTSELKLEQTNMPEMENYVKIAEPSLATTHELQELANTEVIAATATAAVALTVVTFGAAPAVAGAGAAIASAVATIAKVFGTVALVCA
jgi:hypothetical protein